MYLHQTAELCKWKRRAEKQHCTASRESQDSSWCHGPARFYRLTPGSTWERSAISMCTTSTVFHVVGSNSCTWAQNNKWYKILVSCGYTHVPYVAPEWKKKNILLTFSNEPVSGLCHVSILIMKSSFMYSFWKKRARCLHSWNRKNDLQCVSCRNIRSKEHVIVTSELQITFLKHRKVNLRCSEKCYLWCSERERSRSPEKQTSTFNMWRSHNKKAFKEWQHTHFTVKYLDTRVVKHTNNMSQINSTNYRVTEYIQGHSM